MLSKEDILSEFKGKINEAISLVSRIPVEQKAEVWNFWELITITVKLFTQVYVEDHVDKFSEKTSKNNLQKSSKAETSKENEEKIRVSNEKKVKKKQHQTEVNDNEISVRCEIEPASDSNHHSTGPVRSEFKTLDFNEVKTLDFTDLISCPSSVEAPQQDGTVTMYIQSLSCNTPSMSALSQMDETLDVSPVNLKCTDSQIEPEKDDQSEKVICVEIISTDHVTPTEKENKIPPLNLRKVRKKDIQGNPNENTYIIAKGKNISEMKSSRRKSSRQIKKVQNEDYLYEENNSAKKSNEDNGVKKNTDIPNKDGTFKCNDCDKILSNMTALRAHSRKHTGQRPFACRICGRTFSTNGNRIRHEIGHKGEKNFQCEDCQKWFTTAKNLQIHTRVHTGEKPYVCDICDKRFTQLGTLKAHIDFHKGEKRYLCPVCGRAFTQKTNLDTHVLRHNKNNRQFKCQHCTHSCFTKGELERHSFKHSKDKPYLCDFCPKSFTRAQYLKEHKTIHVKSKPYSCQKCTETFPDVSSLRKHKNWHKVQEAEEKQAEGEITAEQEEEQENEDVQQTCIVTTSGVTGMKQIIMATDKDLPADVLQQFVDSAAQMDSDSMSVTHMVPVVAEMDLDGNITHVDSTDDGSQDIYQITFLDTNSDSEHSNIITAVDFSAMNLLANATTHQFN